MSAQLLPLFVAVPLVVAGVLIVVRLPRTVRQGALLAVTAASAVGGAVLLARLHEGGLLVHSLGGWPAPIVIPFVADAFSALLLTLMASVSFVCVLFAIAAKVADEPCFCPLVLIVLAGVCGALLTADLFNLFVFIEIMLLPSYGLIVLAHRGLGLRMQVTATRTYVTVNLLTSTIFLVGIAVVYATTGTVNLGELAGAADRSAGAQLGCAILLMALCIKAAVVPVHGWLTRTYPLMTPTVTALFSGLHTKVAVYALFRLYSVFFAENRTLETLALVLFCLSMVIGVLGAVGEKDARSILSFHMISQIGYMLVGLALFTTAGLAAGVFYLVHHVIAKASLFLSTGAVEMAYGRHELGTVSGLLRREPLTAAVFFVGALSLTGLPPVSGFVAKLSLILASLEADQVAVAVVALAVSLFTMLSMLKIWGEMFLGEPESGDDSAKIPFRLILPATILAAATVVLGIGAAPLLDVARVVAHDLLDVQPYAAAVSGR